MGRMLLETRRYISLEPLQRDSPSELGGAGYRHARNRRSITFSPDGRQLLALCPRQTFVWNVEDGGRVIAGSQARAFTAAAWSPDFVATVSEIGTISLWRASSSQPLQHLASELQPYEILSQAPIVLFSPDGRWFAKSDWNCRGWTMWNVTKDDGLADPIYLQDAYSVYSARYAKASLAGAFSHDSSRLVAVHDVHGLDVWDVASGQKLLALRMTTAGVQDIAFSADGQRLSLLRKQHAAIEIRDSTSGHLLEPLVLEGDENDELWKLPLGHSACFSPCGNFVVSSPATVGGV